MFIIFDALLVPSGDIAIGGTDEYLDPTALLQPERIEGRRVSISLRGGAVVSRTALGLKVLIALTGKRNVFLRIPRVVEDPEILQGAIVSLDLEE